MLVINKTTTIGTVIATLAQRSEFEENSLIKTISPKVIRFANGLNRVEMAALWYDWRTIDINSNTNCVKKTTSTMNTQKAKS